MPPSPRPMTLKVPARFGVGVAEGFLRHFADDAPVDLRMPLDEPPRFELMAETRLLALLAAARRQGVPVDIVSRSEIDVDHGTSKRLVDFFSDTLGGLLLAQLGTRLVDATQADRRGGVTRRQSERAVQANGVYGYGAEQAVPVVDLFGGPPPAPFVRDFISTDFDPLFRSWLTSMNFGYLADPDIESLIDFAYEAFDNTRRHGVRDLDRRPLEGVRFVLLRSVWIEQATVNKAAHRADYAPVSEYLASVGSELSASVRMVELTIADCGIGVPATLANTMCVYSGDWETERHHAIDAFTAGRTS